MKTEYIRKIMIKIK